jgi:hypothetical protein
MLTMDNADGFTVWGFGDRAATTSGESSPERKARRSMGEAIGIWRRRLQSRNGVDQSETNRLANAAQVPFSASMGSFLIELPWLAILVTDIVCYSRLIELNELGTAFRLGYLRRHLIMPMVQAHRGWIVDHAGNGTLMAFARCNDALDCALALQRALHEVERGEHGKVWEVGGGPQRRRRIGWRFQKAAFGKSMRIEIQLRIVSDDNSVISEDEILHFDKGDDRLEAIGLSFGEAKAMLRGIQERVVSAQAASFLARHQCCTLCGRGLLSKGPCRIRFRTAFSTIALPSPRFYHCTYRPAATKTFSPLTQLFNEHVTPELLYLETRWASLVSYGMTTDLLKDILPIGSTVDASTIRRHLHKVAARHEADLGSEQPGGSDGGFTDGQPWPILQAAVIVGKSMAAGRDDRYFGLVRSQDEQPGRRFCEVLRDQGLPVNQAVTMLTDGGDSVRALVGDLPAGSEHHLDWLHVAMRLTVFGQYARGLAHHSPIEATALQDRLKQIKWRLWHTDTDEALTRACEAAEDVAALASGYAGLARLVKATAGLVTYIENNAGALANYSERWHNGKRISTAFVESTVNTVISRRFAKKQQMQWSKQGAHLLLQTRTRTLDGTVRALFTSRYPAANDNEIVVPAAA